MPSIGRCCLTMHASRYRTDGDLTRFTVVFSDSSFLGDSGKAKGTKSKKLDTEGEGQKEFWRLKAVDARTLPSEGYPTSGSLAANLRNTGYVQCLLRNESR